MQQNDAVMNFMREIRGFLRDRLKGDKAIWRILVLFAFISILAVFSSSYRDTMKSEALFSVVLSHTFYLAIGFVAIYWLHLRDMYFFKKCAPVALLFFALLLTAVLILSSGRRIFGFQPSEIARVVMVIYLAKVISEGIKSTEEFIVLILLPIGLFCGLIINGHTSSTILLGFNSTLMIFMGIRKRKYLLVTLAAIIFAGMMYFTFEDYLGRGGTARSRIINFCKKEKTETDSIAKQSVTQYDIAEFAIHSTGWIGKGPGNSKYREVLTQANNDFIFAIIVEEYGITGGIIIISLYMFLFYRTIRIIGRCKKIFPMLMSGGLILMIITQTFVHIGVSVGFLPVTGQNLPLISTGGTSILMTGLAFGAILAVSRQVNEQAEKTKQTKPLK